ncbi:MAG: hypothetical protein BJ554DRAFT_497, partial [Olpidium bornovanus]
MRRSPLLGLAVHAAAAIALLAAGDDASAHMEMKSPPPRRSKFNPHEDYTTIDYSNTAPLAADGSNFPCKGYPPKGNVATLRAGGEVRVELTGGAPHGGGHCQFAVSYDGGRSFGVLKTLVRNCMAGGEGLTPAVALPADLPACSSCVFAWTWINAIGNREFYMNCADVEIQSAGGRPVTLPALTVANLPGYPTVPEFPNPGDPDGAAIFDHGRTVTISSSGGAVGTPPAGNPAAVKSARVADPAQAPGPATGTSGAAAAEENKKAKTANVKTAKAKKTKKKSKSAKESSSAAAAPAAAGLTAPPAKATTAESGGEGACAPGEM